MKNYPVLLSGGSGTRLWPLSRSKWPKQFVQLFENQHRTLFQSAAMRLDQDAEFEAPTVICNRDHRFIIADQLEDCGVQANKIFLEPCGRNTGPAVTTVALALAKEDPDGVMIVMPSDHIIAKQEAFISAVKMAIEVARTGVLTLFGITPSEPHAGYGYIKPGDVIDGAKTEAFRVESFVEKPDASKARSFVESGDHYWNSGIFVLPIKEFLAEVEQLQPDMLDACNRSYQGLCEDLGFLRLEETAFSAAPNLSIDIAIMEKTSNAAIIPLTVGWNDVGSWSTVPELIDKDANGNSISGEVIMQDTSNCMIHAEGRLVAGLGIKDLVIVDTPDALLVCAKDEAQNVPKIVEMLRGSTKSEEHFRNYRPWGFSESLISGPGFQVKRLRVKPDGILSLQRHQHRNEHWVVVSGTARITHGERRFLLNGNESTYIPATEWHRIENLESVPLEIIEVQTGDYLGEDDIERADDVYGRSNEKHDKAAK